HWSLFGAGRLREQPVEKFFDLPIPNYSSLQFWSKLRLAAAFRRGDFAQASADVRHLADLIRTQDILISEMISVALYRIAALGRARRTKELVASDALDSAAEEIGGRIPKFLSDSR